MTHHTGTNRIKFDVLLGDNYLGRSFLNEAICPDKVIDARLLRPLVNALRSQLGERLDSLPRVSGAAGEINLPNDTIKMLTVVAGTLRQI